MRRLGAVESGTRFGLAAALLASSVAAAAAATPTPTPRARLSGGFGRPRATPLPATTPGGHSLADVVRSAQDARGQNPERGTVTIDNKSLVTNPDKGRVSTSRVVPARLEPPAPSPVPGAAPAEPPAASAAGSLPGGTEAEWRATSEAARQRVVTAKARIAELDATVKKLETDFYAWDDGQYRDRVIKPSWDRALQELEEARRELGAAEKDLVDLPENARRAGAQPGWIRE